MGLGETGFLEFWGTRVLLTENQSFQFHWELVIDGEPMDFTVVVREWLQLCFRYCLEKISVHTV